MRKILFLLFFAFAAMSSMGQWPGAYLNRTSQWHLRASGGNFVGTYRNHFRYYLGADTVIGGNTYYKVFRQGVDSFWNAQGAFNYRDLYDVYAGALRETAQERFLVVYPNQTTEKILFSFNYYPDLVQSLPTEANSGCNQAQAQVIPSDIVYLGSTPLRRYSLAGSSKRLIQGVGSEGGLLESGSQCLFFDGDVRLICYSKDGNTLQVSNTLPCPSPGFGSTDCDARFCYSAYDSAQIRIVRFYNTSRLWLPGDSIIGVRMDYQNGLIGTGLPSQVVYFNPGNYTPSLMILTAKGCTSYFSALIQPGNTCSMAAAAELSEASKSSVIFLPNLVRTAADIVLPQGGKADVRIYNASGQLVRRIAVTGGRARFERGALSGGLYFYEAWQGAVRTGCGRIVLP